MGTSRSDQLLNLGILISGRGSNMEYILRAIKRKHIPINPAVVISNRPDALGLAIAERLGVHTEIVKSAGFVGSRKEYDQRISLVLKQHGVTRSNGLVCLAGFMRILGPEFVRKYKNKIMNIHPAILPSFPGLDAQSQAVKYGVKLSGCTVHFVDEGVDSGPIIIQSAVRVRDDDTPESLSRRILVREHKIYPIAVELFARGKIRISKGHTIID